jgi:hypothetical protein
MKPTSVEEHRDRWWMGEVRVSSRALGALALAALTGGCGDDSRTSTFSGNLTADPVGICNHHSFEAERDGRLTITLVELSCPGSGSFAEISVLASQSGVHYLSANLHAGESMSQPNGNLGPYDIEVCMGRVRYPDGCHYTISASQ